MDVNELDEVRIWAISQEASAKTRADLVDSEMIDDNEEVDEGEMEDEDMEIAPDDDNDPANGQENYGDVESAQLREVTQRKKPSRRKNHEPLLNGNAGGTAVRVGDGG
jgi:casein kinase II subunit beta